MAKTVEFAVEGGQPVLIENLENSKKLSTEINEKVEIAKVTDE